MIAKLIRFFDEEMILACDAKCGKAWGINLRPKKQLSSDVDDYEYLADHELKLAPLDPGTYEGGESKPTNEMHRLNKWCARECERSVNAIPVIENFSLPNFSYRIRNINK